MQTRRTPQRLVLPSFALTYCLVLGIIFCLTLILYEYFQLETIRIPRNLPVAAHAEGSLIELYPSVLIDVENHPDYPGTRYWIIGHEPWTAHMSLNSLAQVLPAKLAHTRGRVYIAAEADVPYGDIMKLLAICRRAEAKSIKLIVSDHTTER
jgi:biopolymer transport protein ExbD